MFLQACTFLARGDLKNPSSRLAYAIGDSMKPKTRENITAEVKLRCLSVTVLDSLCGMVCSIRKKKKPGFQFKDNFFFLLIIVWGNLGSFR